MLLETLSTPLYQLRGTSSTDSAGTPPVSRLGPPPIPNVDGTGLGTSVSQTTSPAIIGAGHGAGFTGEYSQNGLLIVPYGAGADNSTFSLTVYRWAPIKLRASPIQVVPALEQWLAVPLCTIACTISTGTTGIAGGILTTTALFCKTLAVTYGNANVSVEPITTAAGYIASFLVDVKGAPLIEVWGDRAGSATSFNALYSWL